MSPDELDNEMEELENRLERLRALYDQYFLGIEKIEPTVARKDVDRRIWILRREQIRNTARRFRLQTLVMRYNTFQQYWQRVCRDIENGTYTRHMLRAERTLGEAEGLTIAARKRLGMFRRGAEKRDAREQRQADDERGTESQAPAQPDSPEPAPGSASAEPAPRPKFDELDLDMDFLAAPEKRAPPASREAALRPARAVPTPKAEPKPTAAALLVPAEPPVQTAAQWSAGLPPVVPAGSRAGLLSRLGSKSKAAVPAALPRPNELAVPRESRRASTPPPAAAAGLSRPAADRGARLTPSGASGPPTRAGPTGAANEEHSAIAPRNKVLPPAAAQQPSPKAGKPNIEKSAHQLPNKTVAGPVRPVGGIAPSQAAPAQPAGAGASSPKAAAPVRAGVTEERIRELHGRLLDAKRQVNDAGKVSVDGLTKSLRAAESRLRQQHGDRRIDFDVVIKDGKAVVKPIVR